MSGRMVNKIYCEAIARHSGKPCLCKGYWTPTKRRFLCTFHSGGKSWDHRTRKYKGLYKNDSVALQNKINILKNLVNFRNKTDDEIKRYILEEKERSSRFGYRTKYYTRQYLRWKNTTYRSQRHIGDQLDDLAQILRKKSKNKGRV